MEVADQATLQHNIELEPLIGLRSCVELWRMITQRALSELTCGLVKTKPVWLRDWFRLDFGSLLEERRSVSRLSANSNDQQCDGKGEDPVDEDEELGVVELALVAQGVLILCGHDLFLQIAPGAV